MSHIKTRDFDPSDKKSFIRDGERLLCLIHEYKEEVKDFYYDVMLSKHGCPICHGKLKMVGTSKAECISCGQSLDPTVVFQESLCCGKKLMKGY